MTKRKRKWLHRSEKGYALPFALGVVIIFIIAGGALITFEVNELNMLVHHYDSRRAYYLAEAGINHALWELNKSPAGDGITSGTLQVGGGNGSYTTTYSQNVLTSVGTYSGANKTITVKVEESTAGGGFGETGALFAGNIDTVPAKLTVWNGLGDINPDRVVITNTQSKILTIDGYVLNYNQPFAGSNYLGWVYGTGDVGPAENVGTHFRSATNDPAYPFPIFDSTDYDNKIANAGSVGTALNNPLTGSQNLSPGTYYRLGDLTISNATIQSSTATRANPVYIVVAGDLTITSSTIGVPSPTTLADPTKPPSPSNPYGNWIRILVRDGASINGTITNRSYLNKEVRLYTKERNFEVLDYVSMNQAAIFTSQDGDLATGGNSISTWLVQDSNTTNHLYGVSFADSNKGIAVGNAEIRYTTNGGNTWQAASSTPREPPTLNSVSFLDSSNAWTVGGSGTIWRSSNGGNTWTSQNSNTSQALNGVSFANNSAGIVVGNRGTIRYTTNGGSGWSTPTTSPGGSPDLKAVSFPNTSQAWAVGTSGVIWKTTDGGRNWSTQSSGTSDDLMGVTFVDANNGWVVGEDGTVLRTPATNGESKWDPQISDGYKGNLQAASALNTYQAIAVGTFDSTSALHATNGGYNWDLQTMPPSMDSDLYGFDFVDQQNGWAVGSNGVILKYTGPSIYLRGTILTKQVFNLSINSNGAEIWVEGAIVSGYRYPDPSNPGSFIQNEGKIMFKTEGGKGGDLEDVMFSLGAMPESQGDDIGVTSGASLVYSTWRER